LAALFCLDINNGLIEPATTYRRFEEIHPFVDGNGRCGKILYNYLHNSLDAPTWPPNYWEVL
jgi:Fic family protein